MALSQRNRLILFVVLFIGLLSWSDFFSTDKQLTSRADWTYPSGFDPHGGYLDRVTFFVYPTGDIGLALQALQAGSIYAFDERIPADYLGEQEAVDSNVEVITESGDMYRMFCLNCDRFPTNITEYRRAFAYALDKRAVVQASTGGLAYLQDCALPIGLANWTYEHQLIETYYSQDISKANACLEASGFRDLNGDGWRDYDSNNDFLWNPSLDLNSSEFAIELEYTAGYAPAGNAVDLAVSGLAKCGIIAYPSPQNFYEFYDMLDWHMSWFVSCFSFTDVFSPDFLFKIFHSSTSNNQWYFDGWTNDTYNLYAENLMASQTVEEANHWAWKCQEILWYEQPMVVCYNDVYTHAYRIDFWEGYVNMACRNRMGNNPWTLRHLRLKEEEGGPWGCFPTEYVLSLTEGLDTTNRLMSQSQHAEKIFSQIYSRLWQFDPFTWEPVPDLAHNWVIEQTNASGDIQKGQKITFNLYPNVTWHDGLPLSSTDVKYSLELYQQFDYTYAPVFGNIYRIDTLGPNTVIAYTNRSGYFEFMHATNLYILPKHIWELPSNLTTWVPTVPQMIGTGPYKITNYVPDEFVVIERHPDWHFAIEMPPRTPCPHSGPSFLLIGFIGIAVIVIQVMILSYLLLRQSRKKGVRKSKESNSIPWRVD